MYRLLFLFLILVTVSLASCGEKTTKGGISDSDSVALDSVADSLDMVDTLMVETFSCKRKLGCWKYESEVEYPVSGSDELLRNVRGWVLKALNYSDAETKVNAFSGDLNDGQAVVDYYARAYMESIDYDNYIDLPDEMECELQIKITKSFENDQVVSFEIVTYWFGGGAHGGTSIYGATFRKSDGKHLGWNLVSSKKELVPAIVEGLKHYFEVTTDEELMENLQIFSNDEFVADVSKIPYPATEPWLTTDGMMMIYQEYEIACYAAGKPVVVIPWKELPAYLSTQNKSLVN